jgi:hypothetical protein
MVITISSTVTSHRPAAVPTIAGVLTFLGLSAFAGVVALVFCAGAAHPRSGSTRYP